MKRLILVLMLACGPLQAADLPFDFAGYVEYTQNAEYLRDAGHDQLQGRLKARLDFSGQPSDQTDYAIGLAALKYSGEDEIDLAAYLPRMDQAQLLPPDLAAGQPGSRPFFSWQFEDEVVIKEAYASWYGEEASLRFGRHKYYVGTGYAYNPIDLFNVKNPLDPTYELEGLDAILFSYALPHALQLELLARFDERLAKSDYQVRLKGYHGGWDWALQYTRYEKVRTDWLAVNTPLAASLLLYGADEDLFQYDYRWHLLGAEFIGEIGGVGLYGEGGYVVVNEPGYQGSLRRAENNHARILLGLDYTFESGLYLMAEYLHLGQGYANEKHYTINDRMAFLTGELISLNRNTLFTGLSYPATDLLEFSCYAIFGINDSSVVLNPWLTWDMAPGLKLSGSLNLPAGGSETQNGRMGPGAMLRLKYNF